MSDIISDVKSDLKIVETGDPRTFETNNDHCKTSDQSSLYIELNHSPTLSHVEQSCSTKKLMKNSKHLSRHLRHSSSREISTRDHAGQTEEIIPEIYLEINSMIKPEINSKMDFSEENSHYVFISNEKVNEYSKFI